MIVYEIASGYRPRNDGGAERHGNLKEQRLLRYSPLSLQISRNDNIK